MITSAEPISEPTALTNPKLSATLLADYEALQNDVLQANEMAADFQRQLAGKSNEFAEMKRLFEKTQTDLAQFQGSILELRQERHRLANEAMRAVAFERKLKDVTVERNRLRGELEVARQSLAKEASEPARTPRERSAQLAEMALEVERLKQQRGPSKSAPSPRTDPEVSATLAELATAVTRLQKLLYALPA